jgi:hypothetical protein
MDAMMAAMMAAEEPPVEMPAEAAPAEAAPEMEALVEPAADAPAEEAPADIDPVMAAMIAAGDMPAPEGAPAPEAPVEESPAENLDAILNAEVDALTSEAPAEEQPPTESPVEVDVMMAAMAAAEADSTEAPTDIDPVAAAMIAAEQEAAAAPAEAEALTEPIIEENEPEQIPAPMDMDAATDAMEGAVEDIEEFLSAENYEYTTVKNGDNTLIIMKTSDGGAMAITYEGNEFDSLEPTYSKDGKTLYKEIMNAFVKDTIKNGGGSQMFRHKGSVVVAK